MQYLYIGILSILSFAFFLNSENISEKENRYKLIWSDEFNYNGKPDKKIWSYELGDACELPCGCGWGNNEEQYYTGSKKNIRIKDGKLLIEAHESKNKDYNFTSSRIVSKGKVHQKFGKIESKIKLPKGKGIWAAFWMLPVDDSYGGWPKSGEIDIMEFVGFEQDSIFGTVHTEAFNHLKGTQKGASTYVNNLQEGWHIYSVEWNEEKIDFFVDKQKYFSFEKSSEASAEWPFNQPFYIILNLAIGGNWGGSQGIDKSIFPQKMEIDYVRIYEKQNKHTLISK